MEEFCLKDLKVDRVMKDMGFSLLGEGKDRRTYLSRNRKYVLKLPTHLGGVRANRLEAETWKKHFNKSDPERGNIYYAPCRLLWGCVLMMRAMSKVFGITGGDSDARGVYMGGHEGSLKDEALPMWARSYDHIDSFQVGQMPNGKFVVYDYGW
jgi:hypothetical protein